MITAQRQRRRHRASTVVASLAAATGLVVGIAAPAFAASEAVVVGGSAGESGQVHGTWPDGDDEPRTSTQTAGLFDLLIDGDTESQAYCIDINTPISAGAELDEIEWDTSGVENLAKVEAILRHYYPNGDGPEGNQITGTNAQKASATQAAIWHYTDGFELTDSDKNNDVVVANYKAILEAVEDGLEGFGEPTVTLSITPPESTEGEAGGLVGPYVISTTADSVTLTPSEGVTLHDAEGAPFTGDVVDGTEVWLSGGEGTGTISASAQAEASAGRVFFTEGVQRLVLASTVTVDATDEAPVSFTAAPTPTTAPPTTVPPTTDAPTTTVPITPETTEVPDETTTVPVVPASNDGGGGLPVTGAQSLVLVGVALALVATGAGFAFVSRRKRLEGAEG